MEKVLTCTECGSELPYDGLKVGAGCNIPGEGGAICRGRMIGQTRALPTDAELKRSVALDRIVLENGQAIADAFGSMTEVYRGRHPSVLNVWFRDENARYEFANIAVKFGVKVNP